MTIFKSKPRYLRLLPGVMLVCGGLLVLNASGLVHDAVAQEARRPRADAMAPRAARRQSGFRRRRRPDRPAPPKWMC